MLPRNLPALLRAAGLTVVEVPGWQERGRPGSFAPVGVLNHHTGASAYGWTLAKELAYAKWMFLTGRSDLPAPLVQIALGRSGTVYLGAAGRANHAGKAKASGSVAAGDGNTLYVGIEWMLSGTETIPAKMRAAGVTLNAVLTAQVTKTSTLSISAHYQTSVTGKWDIGDPKGIPLGNARVMDMTAFRKAVIARRASLDPTQAHHTRWAIKGTGVYATPGGRKVRTLKKGESFAVVNGSGAPGSKWIKTTAGNWVDSTATTKIKPIPVPASREVSLRLVHGSLQATDTEAQIRASIEPLLTRGAHMVSFTEVRGTAAVSALSDLCVKHGYHLTIGKWDEAVAVKFHDAKYVASGEGPVLIKGRAGQWPNRSWVYQTWEHTTLGRLTMAAAHALPKDISGGEERTLNRGYWDQIADWLTWKAKFGRVWIGADTNADDATDHASSTASTTPLRTSGVVSCWDEAQTWPDTHDTRTIDVIYRVKNSKVRLVSARRLAKTPSDHYAIEAVYAVKP